MKRLLTILIFACAALFCAGSGPQQMLFTGTSGGSGGGASLLYDGYNAATNQWDSNGGQPGEVRFQVAVATTVTKISAYIDNHGGDTSDGATISCYIYADSSDNLGTLLYTSSNSITHTSLTTGKVSYDFNFAGASLAATTNYHIVFKMSSYVFNQFNLYHTNGTSTITGTPQLSLWNSSGTIQYSYNTFTNYDAQIRVYGTTP